MVYFCGPLHIAEQMQDEPIYSNSVCSPEDLPEAIDDREGWRERVRDICADGVT